MDQECEASFQELKKRLVTALVLILLDICKDFQVYCDASRRDLEVYLCKTEELFHMYHVSFDLMS